MHFVEQSRLRAHQDLEKLSKLLVFNFVVIIIEIRIKVSLSELFIKDGVQLKRLHHREDRLASVHTKAALDVKVRYLVSFFD